MNATHMFHQTLRSVLRRHATATTPYKRYACRFFERVADFVCRWQQPCEMPVITPYTRPLPTVHLSMPYFLSAMRHVREARQQRVRAQQPFTPRHAAQE